MTLRTLSVWYAIASLSFTTAGAWTGYRGHLPAAIICVVLATAYALLALAAARGTRP